MKNQLQTLRRKAAVTILGGALLAPLLGNIAMSQAAPPSNAPTWGYRNRDDNRNIVVSGVVQRDLSGRDRFTVRLDNGRTTEVISRRNEPQRLSRGDRVELRGDFEKNLFIADSVRVVRDHAPGWGLHATTLKGVVTRDYYGRDFEVRADNSGRSVTVRSQRPEPIRLSNGDRVQVHGVFQNGLFLASGVDILRNDDRLKVDFPATVIRRDGPNRIQVRGDNGRVFTVLANFSLSRYDRNDRVRVVGYAANSTVTASDVDLLRNR